MEDSARSTADPDVEQGAVPRALEKLASGRMVVVVDGEARDNEGSLVMAAQFATAEALNFMNRRAGGWVCLALTPERCDELELEPVTSTDGVCRPTPFMVTIDARDGISNGISAHDQAHSIRVAIDPSKGPEHLVRPGRVQPLRAEPGGVLRRASQVEAAVDLARLAGLSPAAVTCEIQSADGSMPSPAELAAFCDEHRFAMIGIGELIVYRHRADRLVVKMVEVELPTRYGMFRAVAYRSLPEGDIQMAFVKGDVAGARAVLVWVHTGCLTGDVFHSQRCRCGDLLEAALKQIEHEGLGVVVYLDPEPHGRGVLAELEGDDPHAEQRSKDGGDRGARPPVTLRNHGIGAEILKNLGPSSIRVLTNNPKRIVGLEGHGLMVTAQVPIELGPR